MSVWVAEVRKDLRAAEHSIDHAIGRTAIRMAETTPWLSVHLSFFTVLFYIAGYSENASQAARLGIVLAAIAAGALTWVLVALLTNGSALPRRRLDRSLAELSQRCESAQTRLAGVAGQGTGTAATTDLGERLGRLSRDIAAVETDLNVGAAYGIALVILWRQLHWIEEAMIDLAGDDDLDGILSHDELRVEGSKLDRKDSTLRTKIDGARAQLGSGDLAGLKPLLREIREAVDDYRDGCFEEMVRGRADLDHASALLGITAWALLGLAIALGAPMWAIGSVAAFYLIGVGAGLFTQLNGNEVSRSVEDISGYGRAQVRQTVLVSGLAAVAGVILTSVSGQVATSGAQAGNILDALSPTPAQFLIAAFFGFTPSVLIDRLNAWAKVNIADLTSTTGAQNQRA